jgi:hypothetical protein
MTPMSKILSTKIKQFFQEHGRAPYPGEVDTDDLMPTAELHLPLNNSTSDALAHNRTVTSLLQDYQRLNTRADALKSDLEQLLLASESETLRLTAAINTAYREVRALDQTQRLRRIHYSSLPAPVSYSHNIEYSGNITLAENNTLPVNTQIELSPYSDTETAPASYHPGKFNGLPLNFTVKSDDAATKSGVTLILSFQPQTLSSIALSVNHCIAKIAYRDEDDSLKTAAELTVGHNSVIALPGIKTDYLEITLYQSGNSATINLYALNIYAKRFVSNGTYYALPVKLPESGVYRIRPSFYAPDKTHIEFYYATDMYVDGSFNNDPDRVAASHYYFDSNSGNKTALSKLWRYTLIAGVPVKQPNWQPLNEDSLLYYNCRPAKIDTYITGSAASLNGLRNLAVLPSNAIQDSLRIEGGRHAWMFVRKSALVRSNFFHQIRNITPYDKWTTYLVLPSGGDVTVAPNDKPVMTIEVKSIHTESPVEMSGMFNPETQVFSGTLPAGVYSVSLFVEPLSSDLFPANSAQSLTFSPWECIVEKPGDSYTRLTRDVLVYSSQIANRHPLYRYQFYGLNGQIITVPVLSRNNDVDFAIENVNSISDLYNSNEYLRNFYDITYIETLSDNEDGEAVFLSAVLKSSNNQQTPILRGFSIEQIN